MIAQYINHVVLVLDASGSMSGIRNEVIKVVDNTIAYLAQRSKDLDQETRITVYKFNNRAECLVYDKDVLRLPSMAALYQTSGNTALIDATMRSIVDLEQTATLYGDHAFLIYVLTDGEENSSILRTRDLSETLNKLPVNWTLACMVPDQQGVFEAKKFGFSPNNIAVWSTDAKGVKEVGEVIRNTTDTFMVNRTQGIRGSKNLFQIDAALLEPKKLFPLMPSQYKILSVDKDSIIADFVRAQLASYVVGTAYYQLVKPEDVQAKKNILVFKNATGEVFASQKARSMLGLPDGTIRVSPVAHPEYTIFIQSTSYTRKLPANTNLIVLN